MTNLHTSVDANFATILFSSLLSTQAELFPRQADATRKRIVTRQLAMLTPDEAEAILAEALDTSAAH
jgi:hypothetical protein